jgi:hypothetical protein
MRILFAVDDQLEPQRKKRGRNRAAKAVTKMRLSHYCPREHVDTHQSTKVDTNSKKAQRTSRPAVKGNVSCAGEGGVIAKPPIVAIASLRRFVLVLID